SPPRSRRPHADRGHWHSCKSPNVDSPGGSRDTLQHHGVQHATYNSHARLAHRIGQRLPRLGVLHPPALARSAAAGRVIHIHPTRLQLPQLAATAGHGSHQLRRGQGGTPVPPGPHPRRSLVQHHAPHTVHQHHGAVRNLATHRISSRACSTASRASSNVFQYVRP